MGSDIYLVLQFWGTLFLIGAVAYPLTQRLFSGWFDGGYLFSKAVGLMLVTYIVFIAATIHILPFTVVSIGIAMGIVAIAGLLIQVCIPPSLPQKAAKGLSNGQYPRMVILVLEELVFLGAFVFWSWVKGHEASIHALEKFMDFGFTRSILNSTYFPPQDMWYAGFPINYYYFGHTVMAMLTKLSNISLSYSFNLTLAAIFAFTLTMSFSIGYQLVFHVSGMRHRTKLLGGVLTAFLVTLAGNMQTIYAFTKGYIGDNAPPFWTLLWSPSEWASIGDGLNRYWYANATRFIPFTIHEFPSYSFVVSDVHGHVLSLPFILLALALIIQFFGGKKEEEVAKTNAEVIRFEWLSLLSYVFYGMLVGILLMTNALDGPIYLGIFLLVYAVVGSTYWPNRILTGLVVIISALVTCLPFLFHFHSFVSGLAMNCPPAILANTKIGPLLFEGVEKCQHSPAWMMFLLWGFFLYCGGYLTYRLYRKHKAGVEFLSNKITQKDLLLLVWFFVSIALIIFPEFFYFKDIYPAHFRSNTMFKLGYQAFIMFSIVSAYAIVGTLAHKRTWTKHRIFLLFLVPLLFLVSIYPIFSVRSYFNSLKNYQGLYGFTWLQTTYPDDYAAIRWLAVTVSGVGGSGKTAPVVLEADGDSYTDYARVSAVTGLPTVIGWPVHEWLWRGTYDVVAPRRADVGTMYESTSVTTTKELLAKYHVVYVFVGLLEREKYKNLAEWKFLQLGTVVFQQGMTTVYKITQ